MADKSNTQKGNSNAGASKSNANKRYGPCTESAVHKPVPGKVDEVEVVNNGQSN